MSDFHPSVIEGFMAATKGGVIYRDISKAFPIKRSLPHGHIVCILELIEKLKFDRLLYRESTRMLHLTLGTLPLNEVSPPRDDDRTIHVMSQATEDIKPYWYGSKKDDSSKVTVGNDTFFIPGKGFGHISTRKPGLKVIEYNPYGEKMTELL